MFFKHFASKNQLPGFSVTGALAVNGLTYSRSLDQEMACFSVLFMLYKVIYSMSSAIYCYSYLEKA